MDDARRRQADLLVSLAHLLQRNRLALVVLAAGLAGAGNRARGAAWESAAIRWLARNTQAVGAFLWRVSLLSRCCGHAGYRAIHADSRPCRRGRAPRLLRHRLPPRDVLRANRAVAVVWGRPPSLVSVY